MARPTIEAVSDAALGEFARFLHEHLNRDRSPEVWEADFRRSRLASSPNHGFLLREGGRIVGGIGALYADRLIGGRPERFCNITSWCVLPEHRQHSTRLAMALLAQDGGRMTFTDFSPTKVVGATLKFLKFQELDERRAVIVNAPGLPSRMRLHATPAAIEGTLEGEALRQYRDHAGLPWLRHLALSAGTRACHVVYKRVSFKGVPAALLLHVGDRELFDRGFGRVKGHWLARGMPVSLVECRLVNRVRGFHRLQTGFNRKVFLSSTLPREDIDYLYSETLLMDIQ